MINILINQLNPSKASGPNGIPTKIMQMISNTICTPLSKIYNNSVLSETHPEKLKYANVIPTFKKGSRTNIKLQTNFSSLKSEQNI